MRRRLGHLGAEVDALWALARRNVSQAARTGVPGIGGSVYKLALSELRQRIAELAMEAIPAYVFTNTGLTIVALPPE